MIRPLVLFLVGGLAAAAPTADDVDLVRVSVIKDEQHSEVYEVCRVEFVESNGNVIRVDYQDDIPVDPMFMFRLLDIVLLMGDSLEMNTEVGGFCAPKVP